MARSKSFPDSVDPGMPVLAACPSGWAQRKFGDVLRSIERPIALDEEMTYTLVNAKRSRGGIVLRDRKPGKEVKVPTQFIVREGDFVISRRQIIHGACGIVPSDLDGAIVSNEYLVLNSTDELSTKYLSYFSHTPYFQRTCFHSSVGVDVEKMVFKEDQWFQFPFLLPPLPEQKKIAAILSSVDELIAKTEAVIAQLQIVKKAMMEQLLTKGMPGRHTRFKQTEIGEIPEEWEVVQIGEIGFVQAGRQRNPSATGKPRPYLRVANVFDGRIDVDDVLEMPFTDDEFLRYQLRSGDVLLNEGQSIELVGRCSAYHGELGVPCAFQNTLIRFQAGPRVLWQFAVQLFRWMQISGAFAEVATQTTSIAHLGVSRFAGMRIKIPQLREQQQILAVLEGIDRTLDSQQRESIAIRTLKSALSSSLLSGELRVIPEVAE